MGLKEIFGVLGRSVLQTTKATLFEGVTIKGLNLKNRLVMAPMTRLRAHADGKAAAVMAQYYQQRASAGLIITEATMVSPLSHGYMFCPGIYAPSHAAAWQPVTESVHAADGVIFLQIWHSGRVAHPSLLDGVSPVAPSALAGTGTLHSPIGKVSLPVPEALSLAQIADIVKEFANAAQLAKQAGFDGVEIHGAFGYLIDQFLQDVSNKRNDAYGGDIANRARFMEEVVAAVCDVFPGRTGIKLSPANTFYGMGDSDPVSLFKYVCSRLNQYDLAYVHFMEPNEGDLSSGALIKNVVETFRADCEHLVIANGGFDKDKASDYLASGQADLISFGRPFIANPNLPYMLEHDQPLVEASPTIFYGQGPTSIAGYTDFSEVK